MCYGPRMTGWGRLLCVSLVAGLSGCEDVQRVHTLTGTCQQLAERLAGCRLRGASSPGDFVEECRKYPDYQPMLVCSQVTSCTEFEPCLTGMRGVVDPRRRERRVKKRLEELQRHLETMEYESARELCRVFELDLDPHPMAQETCEGLPLRVTQGLTKELTRLRDEDLEASHISRCVELRRYAQLVSDETALAAELLCDEAAVSIDVRDVMAQVDTKIAAGELRLPNHCEPVLSRLDGLHSEWSKTMKGLLANRCYVTLGGRILSVGSTGCNHQLRRVLAGLQTSKLESAVPATKLKRAKQLCSD